MRRAPGEPSSRSGRDRRGQVWVDWQRSDLARHANGRRHVVGHDAWVVPVAVVVEHDLGVVDTAADASPVNASTNSSLLTLASGVIRMVNWWYTWVRPSSGSLGSTSPGTLREAIAQCCGVLSPRLVDLLEPTELREADRRSEVRQTVVVAGDLVLVSLPHALVAEQAQAIGDGIVVVVITPPSPVVMFFVAYKLKQPMPKLPAGRPRYGADGLRGVLDDRQPASLATATTAVHVRHVAVQVHRHAAPSSARSTSASAIAPGSTLKSSPMSANRAVAPASRIAFSVATNVNGRRDHLVARADAEGLHRRRRAPSFRC